MNKYINVEGTFNTLPHYRAKPYETSIETYNLERNKFNELTNNNSIQQKYYRSTIIKNHWKIPNK